MSLKNLSQTRDQQEVRKKPREEKQSTDCHSFRPGAENIAIVCVHACSRDGLCTTSRLVGDYVFQFVKETSLQQS